MLAAGILENGWLGVLGTKGDDNIQVQMSGGSIRVNDNGTIRTFNAVPTIAILCQAGDDQITIDDNVTIPVWIDGGKGDDTIKGGSGNDVVLGGAGNDTIGGGGGDDWLFGAAGNDDIQCGNGDDIAGGGKGHDIIHGGDGDDLLSGEAGHDAVYGELGDDYCEGAAGKDLLEGGDGSDELMGGGGIDLLFGGNDDDLLDGGGGKDDCRGGAGDDRLKGGAGRDFLDGDSGDNLLDKDKGKDDLFNGIEADLDLEYRLAMAHQDGGTGVVSHVMVNDNGTVKTEFKAEVKDLGVVAPLDVVINGVMVGQIVTDGSGDGELVFSTSPSANESPFPQGFPVIRKGSTVSIGGAFQAKFIRPFFLERQLPELPTP